MTKVKNYASRENMEINFRFLHFEIKDKKITMNNKPFAEIQIAGENKDSHLGNKMVLSSEGRRLNYLSHSQEENALTIYQQSDLVLVKTVFVMPSAAAFSFIFVTKASKEPASPSAMTCAASSAPV